MPYKIPITIGATIASMAFCLSCGYIAGKNATERKYIALTLKYDQQVNAKNLQIQKLHQDKQNYVAKISASNAQVQIQTINKYQTAIKEVIKYVKSNPNDDVDIPAYWVFGILNSAINNTAVPNDGNIARLVSKTPTFKTSAVIGNDVNNYYECNIAINQLNALIDEVNYNMEVMNK